MVGFYNYTVILTYIGTLCGIVGIYECAMGRPWIAIILLLACGFCDMFDGAIAKTKKDRTDVEKKFGIQIDSLSDFISFGLLPAMIGYSVGMNKWYHVIVFCLFILCALIRLAYYNVTEDERQKQTNERRKHFEGLPVTNTALIFPIFFSFSNFFGKQQNFTIFYMILMIIVALLFVIKFKMFKAGKRGLTVVAFFGLALVIWIGINFSNLIEFWS